MGRRGRSARAVASYSRRLRVEQLEERRMLASIADTFDTKFAQVSRITGAEVTVLTADAAGATKIFYHPNDELGYIDPATGDLLFGDYYPGTSTVLVLNMVANGSLNDLVGVTYSNGQAIATDGGSTVYHKDGSLMRSGGVWTYDAGATLESGGNYFWSNGNAMISGSTLSHPNGTLLRDTSNTLYYAAGGTFINPASGAASYPGGQTLRSTTGDYFYQSGTALLASEAIHYANGTEMVDANGDVFYDTGTPSFKPFTRIQNAGTAEYFTHVNQELAQTTLSFEEAVAGGFAAYVGYFEVAYSELPPDPVDLEVTYVDDTTLLFEWASGGESTAGYRVAWSDGVSAPGDISVGVDVTDNYYVVTGLTPGQKVSLRVAAKDADGDLSYGSIITGTAGALVQTPHTGQLIASALETTFVQVYDSVNKNIIFTIDQDNNSFVWYYVNAELGYVNIDNGDRLEGTSYVVPGTSIHAGEVADLHVVGNLSQITDGAHYQNGQLVRSGDVYYHENGAVLRSADGIWFYPSGNTMKNATTTFWPANITMRSTTTSRYPNNAILKSGSTISYQSGTTFLSATSAFYPAGTNLKVPAGIFYETGASLYDGTSFRYQSGATMINSAGAFFTSGEPASLPFVSVDTLAISTVYVGHNVDHIGRYAIPVLTNNAVHVLGGSVDYSVVPPPKPLSLDVDSTTSSAVTLSFTSAGGTTQDYVYAYNLGPTAPYTADGGTVVAGPTFTIAGLAPGQQVAVRLFARNAEGELSPGITAVATTTALPDLPGDYNLDHIVDAGDYTVWRDTLGSTSDLRADGDGDGSVDADDYDVWKLHFGEVLEQGAGSTEQGGGGALAASQRLAGDGGEVIQTELAVQEVAPREAGFRRGVRSRLFAHAVAAEVSRDLLVTTLGRRAKCSEDGSTLTRPLPEGEEGWAAVDEVFAGLGARRWRFS